MANPVDILDEYDVSSVQVSKGIQDTIWTAAFEIKGQLTIPDGTEIMVKLKDHTGTDQVVFIGVAFNRNISYDEPNDKTTFRAYDMAYYLNRQNVPLEDLYSPSSQEPAQFITKLLGGAQWDSITGIEPYRIKNYYSYDPNNLVWGDISRPFKFAPKTSKRTAIDQDLADYTNYVFAVIPRNDAGTWKASGYWCHSTQLDSDTDGFSLPTEAVFANPDEYTSAPFVGEDMLEEMYNRVTVMGFDTDGVLHKSTYEKATVTAGTERPLEYLEEGSYDTDMKCQMRAADLFYYYIIVPKTYIARLVERCDLRLYQKIKWTGYTGISEQSMRISKIGYSMTNDEAVRVDVEAIPASMFSHISALKRASTPFWSRETSMMISRALDGMPQVEIGEVIAMDGNEATVETELGPSVDGRVVNG